MQTELLIDGLNNFIRHFSTNPKMSLHNEPCGAIAGVLGTIYRGIEKYKPDRVTVAWEGGGSARRRALYPDYKAGRKPLSLNRPYADYEQQNPNERDNWDWQLRTLIHLLPMLKIGQIYVDDCEADDAIAYICRWKCKDDAKIIISTDHDYLQLIDDKTRVWAPRKHQNLYDAAEVKSVFNIQPYNFCVARCFTGDTSDNIQGIQGISYKYLSKIASRITGDDPVTIDEIYQEAAATYQLALQNKTSVKQIEKVINYPKATAQLNWQLMNLESPQLSGTQIQQIIYQHDQPRKMSPKLEVKKFMLQQGLNNIDVDTFGMMVQNTLLTT
jgi:5'-3' exonuclease